MTVMEEVQLAIDMNIESALEFVLIAKTNYHFGFRSGGYWGYFNGRLRWISCQQTGKQLCYHELKFWHDNFPGKMAQFNTRNTGWETELWDSRANKPFPLNYWTDKICQLNYELKANENFIGKVQGMERRSIGRMKKYYRLLLADLYEEENRLKALKQFNKNEKIAIKTGHKSKTINLRDTKNYSLYDIIVGYGLSPVRAGNNRFKMLCPFHNEKTPSFLIDTDRNRYKCFGCQEGGDTLDFVSKYEKIGTIAAARKLSTGLSS